MNKETACQTAIPFADESSSIFKLLEKLKRDLQGQARETPINSIETRIKKYSEETENLINTLSQGNLCSAFIQRVNARISELDDELSKLIKEQERLQKDANLSDEKMQADTLAEALSRLKDGFPGLSIYDKRALVKLLAEKIVWDGTDLHVFLGSGE